MTSVVCVREWALFILPLGMFRNAACTRRQHICRAPTRGEEREHDIDNKRTGRERPDWPNRIASRCDVSKQPIYERIAADGSHGWESKMREYCAHK